MDDDMLTELRDELAAPFPPERISWRVKQVYEQKNSALVLAYIDARDVYERLDEVVGVGGWQCRHDDGGDGRLTCSIGLELNGQWVWKSDGAGSRQASAGLSEQDANKGDYSDALKRAAVAWGIGRYLYAMGRTYADVEQKGRTWVIADSAKPKLNRALKDIGVAPAGMATRGEKTLTSVIIQSINTFCTSPSLVDEYIEKNKGMLEKLTNAQKEQVWGALQRAKEQGVK
jgi:hypothetical protein